MSNLSHRGTGREKPRQRFPLPGLSLESAHSRTWRCGFIRLSRPRTGGASSCVVFRYAGAGADGRTIVVVCSLTSCAVIRTSMRNEKRNGADTDSPRVAGHEVGARWMPHRRHLPLPCGPQGSVQRRCTSSRPGCRSGSPRRHPRKKKWVGCCSIFGVAEPETKMMGMRMPRLLSNATNSVPTIPHGITSATIRSGGDPTRPADSVPPRRPPAPQPPDHAASIHGTRRSRSLLKKSLV